MGNKAIRNGESIHVRLPLELEEVARKACKLTGMKMSKLVRAGLEKCLAELLVQSAELAQDPSVPGRRRMQLALFVKDVVETGWATHGLSTEELLAKRSVPRKAWPKELKIRRPDPSLRKLWRKAE